jgi:hypothetical protein
MAGKKKELFSKGGGIAGGGRKFPLSSHRETLSFNKIQF